jgi:hypothetical protein
MTEKESSNYDYQFAELQQKWHGWGSPVGLGIGLLCLGGFALLVATAISLFI